jgi:hypothetical protein
MDLGNQKRYTKAEWTNSQNWERKPIIIIFFIEPFVS